MKSRTGGSVAMGWVLVGIMTTVPFSLSEAQSEGLSVLSDLSKLGQLGEMQKGVQPTDYVTLTCPADGRQFQIGVSAQDIEFYSGTKQITCPYDGTVFFPNLVKAETPQEEKTTLTTVRCPVDGREFKAELNVEGVLAGRTGASLRCPYDGTKFRLAVLGTPEKEVPASLEAFTAFRDLAGGSSFQAFVGEGATEELFSPFDGSPVSPDDMIPPQFRQSPFGLRGQRQAGLPLKMKPELSRIEELFVKGVPRGIPRDIRQFGYDIFSDRIDRAQREQTTRSALSAAQGTSSPWDVMRRFEGILGAGNQPFQDLGGLRGLQSAPMDTGMFSTIPIGSDYVVGPGDTLILNIWGSVQQSTPVTVDADGKIMLPKAGPVYVWGLTFSEVEELIKQSLQEHYANFNLSLSMGRLRTIRIFVFGEVKAPGTYYLSPQATVLHALYAASGPTKLGTLRQVKLLRADKTEEVVDLYDILIRGDNRQDLLLRANDTLLVPPIGNVVGVAGNVKRPAIYETTGPVSLTDILEMGGGLSAAGYLQRIQIERIKDHERKVVQDFEFALREDLERKGVSIRLQDGDLVTVFPIAAQRRNFVSILGNVERPGDYELKGGMHLRDLIEKAGGILPGTYLERAELARYRTNKDREIIQINLRELFRGEAAVNRELEEWDVVTVFSKSEVIPPKFVEISGTVHEPGRYELTESMHISDLLFKAGGLRYSAAFENAELFRTEKGGGTRILPVDLRAVIAGDPEKDLSLSEGDRLFIREAITDVPTGTVALSGEFQYPGEYAILRGETLSSVIRRAGGFTDSAFLEGAIFTREALRQQQLEQVKTFLKAEQVSLLQEQVSLAGEKGGSNEGLLQHRKELLEKIDKSEFLGRMVVRLSKPEALAGTPSDFPLEDGDALTVPKPPSSVMVIGNVYTPTAVRYVEGRNLSYYLRRVGGMTKGADQKRVYVVRADGETVSQFARVKRVERGDTIIVPEQFKYRVPRSVLLKDTVSFIAQFVFGAITLNAID